MAKAGISSYGAYIPWHRMERGLFANAWGGFAIPGEKAIANHDEDSVTMAVAAAMDCLSGLDPHKVDGLFFASTTSPYREKQCSATIATALDLREDILTADFANSLRAGTTALRAALDSVKAGTAKRILVIAADMRPAMPGTDFERLFGDGAVAFTIGANDVRIAINDSFSNYHEIIDTWRTDEDRFVRSWEERFVIDEGYLQALPKAVDTLMKRNGLTPKDFNKVAIYAPDARRHRDMAKRLGFDTAQVEDPLFGSMGDTGAAFSLMIPAAALEETSPGDKLLLASYGNGADALFLEAVGKPEGGRGLKSYLHSKRVLKDYVSYLRWRGILEMPVRGTARPSLVPSASALHREEEKNLRLHGVKCRQCGTVQYPPQRVCNKCNAKDDFEKYPFWDKKAELFTYSPDFGIPSPDPPYVLAVVNFEGGGRIWLTMTDKEVDEIEIGMPLELTFRRLATVEHIHNYFWKCMPVRI